ncbi:MAG: LUD domain-containing protein [Deltaproteobacteria bacterium]|nr:LUD domain-containing protein [Deltaproteobacteria bacterium]
MADFHELLASVRAALATNGDRGAAHDSALGSTARDQPAPAEAGSAELVARFAREFELVNGRMLGVMPFERACARALELARELKAQSVAVGAGAVNDMTALAATLKAGGLEPLTFDGNPEADRARMRERLAGVELAVVEAHYAVASTGTLALLGGPRSPNSLTLLAPVNLVLVQADRVLRDVAAAVSALGAEAITSRRLALVTGPSRTADIEKKLVLGAHGPREVYAIVLGPEHE